MWEGTIPQEIGQVPLYDQNTLNEPIYLVIWTRAHLRVKVRVEHFTEQWDWLICGTRDV